MRYAAEHSLNADSSFKKSTNKERQSNIKKEMERKVDWRLKKRENVTMYPTDEESVESDEVRYKKGRVLWTQ